MIDTNKNNEKNIKATPPIKEGGEAKENNFKLSKKQSYIDNNCLLKGIDLGRVIDFNKGLPINLSQKELEANGVIFNATGMVLPYRWMEVSNGS